MTTIVEIERPEKVKSDFNPGDIVSSGLMIILCTNDTSQSANHFSGIILKSGGVHKNGTHDRDWLKSLFSPFIGVIKLTCK